MKRLSPTGGYSLPELLVTIVILGVIGAVGAGSLLNIARRERSNTVASELAGWLDQVNRDASRFNAQACTVTISTGDLAPGDQLAAIAPAACAPQNTLTVPDLYFNNPTANITANITPPQFVFTPRGTLATVDDSALPGEGDDGEGEVLITITVNNADEVRCVRLTGLIGVLEVGRNNDGDTCSEWSRV